MEDLVTKFDRSDVNSNPNHPQSVPVKCYRPFSRKFFFPLGIQVQALNDNRPIATSLLWRIKSVAPVAEALIIASLTTEPTIYNMKRVLDLKTAVNKSANLKINSATLTFRFHI